MPRWLRRLWYRLFPIKLPTLELADTPLNRSSAFWWEVRARGDRILLTGIGPDGLYDVMLTRVFAPGSSVTADDGTVTEFPKGAEQNDMVMGVNPKRFEEKK
jgi:hypothetical protein